MNIDPKQRLWLGASAGAFAAFGAIAFFVVFGFVAYLLYPAAYDPYHNVISDLGNPQVNTNGALIYEIGVVLSGVLILAFSTRVGLLIRDRNVATALLLRLGQAAGIFCGVSLLLVAVFPLGTHTDLHNVFSSMLWFGMSFFELFVATALLRICGVRAWMSHLGFLAVAIDLLGGFFVVADVMEWVTVALAFAFIGVVAQALRRHSRREQIPAGRGF